jgi:hypothetical protein
VRTTPLSLTTVLVVALAATSARADALRIETLEDHTWPASVAALQKDRDSEGRVVHVVVKDGDGARLHCGTYAVGLDAAGAEAFTIEGCEDATDSTALRLTHRSALFEHGDVVSKPRAPRITASRQQTGAASGGAKTGAESAVDCQVTVHPFIRDLENGGRVDLAPGRYALMTKSDSVAAKPTDNGWILVAPRGTNMTVEYSVTDLRKDEVVLTDRVTMNCSVQTASGTGEVVPARVVHDTSTHDGADTAEPDGKPGLPWSGQAITANFGLGSAVMRTSSIKFVNADSVNDPSALGIHDAAGPLAVVGIAYERPGIYSSLSGAIAASPMSHRTLWYFGASSVIAAALHLGDTALYLGPNVSLGTYQLSADTSQALAYTSKAALSAGAAAGVRFHLRDDKTGKLNTVIGGEIVAPIAGPSPWLFVASIAFGK